MAPAFKGENMVHVYRDIYIKDKTIYGIRINKVGIAFLSNNVLIKNAVFAVRKNRKQSLRNIHAYVMGLLVIDVEEVEKVMAEIKLSKEFAYYDQRKKNYFRNQHGVELVSSKYAYATSDINGGSYLVLLDAVHVDPPTPKKVNFSVIW